MMDKSVIPRQLLQLSRAPFLGIFTTMLSVQSFGISFPFHMVVMSGRSILTASLGSALNGSALRLSYSVAFLSSSSGIAMHILEWVPLETRRDKHLCKLGPFQASCYCRVELK